MSDTRYWENSCQYQRILEILDAYWLTQKDELKVRISMDFIKANGETQAKEIVWRNPDIPPTKRELERMESEPTFLDLADIPTPPDYEGMYKRHQKFWDV